MRSFSSNDKLQELSCFNFPRKVGYSEFVRIFDFIDGSVYPCRVNYEVTFIGDIGLIDYDHKEVIVPHKRLKGLNGWILPQNDSNRRTYFGTKMDIDVEGSDVKTLISSIHFDCGGYETMDELEDSGFFDVDSIKRIRTGLEVYFNEFG